ncbi:hypothetical protein [Chloroflexus sp.]|uniref:hypothetical protein n=1 Tax=Chloroflexus sp. TaxID=1904827 RepID=UPI00298F15BE|nr:hypothetical protein [Chloroflexus sp.]MCS6888833.1 hypothetical protein [Chloroflexus sp.]MDW8405579.1 hypothetical protein [Chloroflexus sp.]
MELICGLASLLLRREGRDEITVAKEGNMSRENLTDTLIKLSGVLGFFTALVSFVLQISGWLHDPETLHMVSGVAFAVYFGCTLWFAFKAQHVSLRWRWISLAVLYAATIFYFTWVGTWLVAPAAKPIVVDDMTGISVWSIAKHTGALLTIHRVTDPENETHAIQLDYTLAKGSWVAMYREISSAALAGTRAVGFSFKGSGAPNTLEFKLFRKPDQHGKSAIFGVLWNSVTNTDDWRYVEVPYSLFVCWLGTGCKPGEVIRPEDVWKIDIAISNRDHDTPGQGTLLVGPIVGIP